MTGVERRTHRRTIIENQATSGISAAAYSREGQVHPSLFYSLRQRVRGQQPCTGSFLELLPDKLTEAATPCVRLRLSGKLPVEADRGFDSFTLRAVVETLGGLS